MATVKRFSTQYPRSIPDLAIEVSMKNNSEGERVHYESYRIKLGLVIAYLN